MYGYSSVTNNTETITAINNASIGDIIASSNSSGEVQLSSASGADIVITHGGSHGIFFDGHTDVSGSTISVGNSVAFKGQIQLTHSSTDTVKISGDDVAEIIRAEHQPDCGEHQLQREDELEGSEKEGD